MCLGSFHTTDLFPAAPQFWLSEVLEAALVPADGRCDGFGMFRTSKSHWVCHSQSAPHCTHLLKPQAKFHETFLEINRIRWVTLLVLPLDSTSLRDSRALNNWPGQKEPTVIYYDSILLPQSEIINPCKKIMLCDIKESSFLEGSGALKFLLV